MRATVQFDVDVSRVPQTMAALILEETAPLHQAVLLLENTPPENLHEGLTSALQSIEEVANQLRQYQQMLVSFEQAKFQTVLPQRSDQAAFQVNPNATEPGTIVDSPRSLQNVVGAMSSFDGFVEKISSGEEQVNEDTKQG